MVFSLQSKKKREVKIYQLITTVLFLTHRITPSQLAQGGDEGGKVEIVDEVRNFVQFQLPQITTNPFQERIAQK